jgi:hypothetical protein
MRFGLFGSAQARRSTTNDVDSSLGYRQWLDYNVEAEALGYHSTFAVEHHFTGFGQVSATLNLLTYLAARTSTIRLGTAVTVLPWHNPVLLAEQAATLDLLSGGRLDFGVGKGYRHNEFAGFCIPMDEAQARFEESLEVITKAWVSNEPFSHRGRFWQYENIVVEPPRWSPSAATICCSTSIAPSPRRSSGATISGPRSKSAAASSTRWKSAWRVAFTSPGMPPTAKKRSTNASRRVRASTSWPSDRTATTSRA